MKALAAALSSSTLALALVPSPAAAEIRFSAARSYPASPFSFSSVYGAGSIASADFDGDRHADLVVNNCEGRGPIVLRNRGDGSLAAPLEVPSGADACEVGVADLDADGLSDIAAASWDTRKATVLLGNGDLTFSKAGSHRFQSGPPMQFAFADFNRDRRLDIAALGNNPGTVTMLLGRGDGTFANGPTAAAANVAMSFTSGDFDHDGREDLVVGEVGAGPPPDDVVLLLGRGNGAFERPARYPVGSSPEYVASADLDGDGRLDLVAANANSNELSLLYGDGDGSFEPQRRIRGGRPLDGKPGVQLADLDNDGLLDIASTETLASRIEILRNAGGRRLVAAADLPAPGNPQHFVVDDLNGDGLADVAIAGYSPADLSLPLTTEVSVLFNASPRPRLRLRVRPRRAAVGRRVSFRFLVRVKSADDRPRGVRRAEVRFAGHKARTHAHGRARISARFRRSGTRDASATRRGYRRASVPIAIGSGR